MSEVKEPPNNEFTVLVVYTCPKGHTVEKTNVVGGQRPNPPQTVRCPYHPPKDGVVWAMFDRMSRSITRHVDN